MWTPTVAAFLLLGGAAAPHPAAPPPQAEERSLEDLKAAFLGLEDEYTDAYNAWRSELTSVNTQYRKAREADPGAAPPVYPERVEPGFFARFDRLAQLGSMEAQVWCLKNYVSDAPKEAREQDFVWRFISVLQDGQEHHGALPQIVSMHSPRGADSLLDSKQAAALLTVVETAAPSSDVKSSAAYLLASMAPMDGLSKELSSTLKLESMRRLAKRYPGTGSAKQAEAYVFRMEHLQVGMVAPDIVGKDVDGNDMKLSDFRGKVAVIDFWGFW